MFVFVRSAVVVPVCVPLPCIQRCCLVCAVSRVCVCSYVPKWLFCVIVRVVIRNVFCL